MVAFDTVGGESYLAMVAKKNPAVFCMLLAKVLPMQITGAAARAIETAGMSARERIERRLADMAARNRKADDPRVPHQ
jgi:hypothetical protein